ncbi:hypothetical protein BC829DRAFT_380058, partial [Chytridium lagenaria]
MLVCWFVEPPKLTSQANKSAAKNFSLKAHELNQLMQDLHSEASYNIYQSRNPSTSSTTERVIDLHGLHPLEAVKYLGEALDGL